MERVDIAAYSPFAPGSFHFSLLQITLIHPYILHHKRKADPNPVLKWLLASKDEFKGTVAPKHKYHPLRSSLNLIFRLLPFATVAS